MFSYEKLRPSLKMFYFLLNLMNCSHKNRNVYIPFFCLFRRVVQEMFHYLSFFQRWNRKKKEAIHRSISSIIQIHLSTVRSNIVVYILPKVSIGIIRLFCFTFQKEYIPKRAHYKKATFQKEYIPKRAHSKKSTFQKGHIQYSKKSTFQKEHIPKRPHSKKSTFQKGHISKRAHRNRNKIK